MILNNAVSGDYIQWCIAGIGLNINQLIFPEDCPNPVSLKMESGNNYNLMKELELVLRCIDRRYSDLAFGKSKQQKTEYLNLIFQFGQEATYIYDDHLIRARIEGVDEFGRLLLHQDTGRKLCCDIKEIQYVI
jgi:BirA family biotin operon repressor/biotin-[acetyl-CoA-carboxylase] ligase